MMEKIVILLTILIGGGISQRKERKQELKTCGLNSTKFLAIIWK